MRASLRLAVTGLRDAGWLHAERARTWCRILAAITAFGIVAWIGLSHGGVDREGKPLGTDFVSFWTAARLALDGHVAAVYDPVAYGVAQAELFPQEAGARYMYPYPPPFLLLCLPFAKLPYLVALVVWLGAGFAAFFACVRRILPQRWGILPLLAFPAVLSNLGHGHNGFLTAACLGGCMLFLERRPFVAGLCLGVLIFKPHLLLAAPVALLAARRWRAIAGAATSALGFCALSWLALGQVAWAGFRNMTSLSRAMVEQGIAEFWKMQSIFAFVRLLHGGVGFAYAVQIPIVVALLAVVAAVARKRPGAHAEGAVLVAATVLCPPYLMDYDLVCVALPLAWVMAEAQRNAWLPWEKIVLLAAYALPLFARPVAMVTHVSLAPPVLLALFAVVARRAALGRGLTLATLGGSETFEVSKGTAPTAGSLSVLDVP
jgi:alpha-1,2-mannosyltransferase